MSVVAVFVTLGGTSYAAFRVTGKNVKNNSLTGADFRDNTLGSGDVRNGSLRLRDLRSGELASVRAAQAPAGPVAPVAPGGPASTWPFGRVAADGQVDKAASKDIELIFSGGTPSNIGLSCLIDTAGTPKSIALTIDISGADSRKGRVAGTLVPEVVAKVCPAVTNAAGVPLRRANIAVFTASDGVNTRLPYYIAVTG